MVTTALAWYRGAMFWGRAYREKALVRRFVAAINARDEERIARLMTEDFAYIDSWREGVEGRDIVLGGLRTLFAADGDFAVEIESAIFDSPCVLMRGTVRSGQFGHRRAVWRVLTRGDRVCEWQSWAEGGPPPMTRALAPADARDFSGRAADKPADD